MQPKILTLGNEFIESDSLAIKVANTLKKENPNLEFIHIKDTFKLMEILKEENSQITILDVAQNLTEPKLLNINDLQVNSITTAHDLDAGFVLKLLGNNKNIKIIGIPINGSEKEIKKKVKELI